MPNPAITPIGGASDADISDAIANLPSLEASEDTPIRIGDWDDSVSGILRPVPSRDIPVLESFSFNPFASAGASSTSETSLLLSTHTIAADEWQLGTRVQMKLFGAHRNAIAAGANTATIRVKIGSLAIVTVPFAVPQAASASVNFGWAIDVGFYLADYLGARALGGWTAVLSDEGVSTNLEVRNFQTDSTTAIDLSTSKAIDITVQNSLNNAATLSFLYGGTIAVSNETAP